jgi:hypothetical protein
MSGMIEEGQCNAPQAGRQFFIIKAVSLRNYLTPVKVFLGIGAEPGSTLRKASK